MSARHHIKTTRGKQARLHGWLSHWMVLLTAVLSLGGLSLGGMGCSANPAWDTPTPTPGQIEEREVLFYLYPSSESGIPAQATAPLRVESGKYGIVPLDLGVNLTGILLLERDDKELGVPVSGTLTAVDPLSKLSYTTTSSEKGEIKLRLPAASYDISVTWDGNGVPFPPQFFTGVSITARDEGSLPLPTLDSGEELEVYLTDGQGVPVEGVNLYLCASGTEVRSSVVLSEGEEGDGYYRLLVTHGPQEVWAGPTPKNMRLASTWLGTAAIAESEQKPLSFMIQMPINRFSGRVVDALVTPLEGVTVLVNRYAEGQNGLYSLTLTTGTDGTFGAELPVGDYDLVFRPSGVTSTQVGVELSGARLTRLTVTESTPLNVGDVTLTTVQRLEGRVVDAKGLPLEGVSLLFSSTDKANLGSSATTDSDGLYSVRLGVGEYIQEAIPPLGSAWVRSVGALVIDREQAFLTDVELSDGWEAFYRFTADLDPVPGLLVEVRVVPESDQTVTRPQDLLATALTDNSGEMRLVLPYDPSTQQP